jgi:hypothetical protein
MMATGLVRFMFSREPANELVTALSSATHRERQLHHGRTTDTLTEFIFGPAGAGG